MPHPFTPVDVQQRIYFPSETHPTRVFERRIAAKLTDNSVLLDVGCGRTAPHLRKYKGAAKTLYGIDMVPFTTDDKDLILFNGDACSMPDIPDDSVDLAYSHAVMEHVEDPENCFREIARVLKPGGSYMFLTPSIFDYGSIGAAIVPNAWHPKIVNFMTGRAEEDVFPTFFRCNSKRATKRWCSRTGLYINDFGFMGQYPDYFKFNRVLFWLGSMYEMFIRSVPMLHPLRGWIYVEVKKPEA